MKIAGVQMDIRLGEKDANLAAMATWAKRAAEQHSQLTIFPECAVTGYCFDSLEEAAEQAEPIPGPATDFMTQLAAETDQTLLFGMLELGHDGKVFNVAVLVTGQGVASVYRKVHLPWLGVDRFTSYGDRPFDVQQAGEAVIGMTICYDAAFPEAARELALAGADLIALPTNWPPGAEAMAEHVVNTRAMENAVYYAAVNRVGEERGFQFIGRSRICGPSGETLVQGSPSSEELLVCEITPARARNKRMVRVPKYHIIDRMADRRPEFYHRLIQSHDLTPPGRGANHDEGLTEPGFTR